jgi:hypothetical protein
MKSTITLQDSVLKRKGIKRIAEYSGIGAATLGSLGALSGYANARAGIHKEKALKEKLDNLIEFGFRTVKSIGTSPLGREMIKAKNEISRRQEVG